MGGNNGHVTRTFIQKRCSFGLLAPLLLSGLGGGVGVSGGGGANDGHVSRTFIKTLQFGFFGPYHE